MRSPASASSTHGRSTTAITSTAWRSVSGSSCCLSSRGICGRSEAYWLRAEPDALVTRARSSVHQPRLDQAAQGVADQEAVGQVLAAQLGLAGVPFGDKLVAQHAGQDAAAERGREQHPVAL